MPLVLLSCWNADNSAQLDSYRYDPPFTGAETLSSKRFSAAYNVINKHCLQCHLEYRTTDEQEFVALGVVIPSSPENSSLYTSLKGANVAKENESMPPEEVLLDWEVEAIRNWIANFQ